MAANDDEICAFFFGNSVNFALWPTKYQMLLGRIYFKTVTKIF